MLLPPHTSSCPTSLQPAIKYKIKCILPNRRCSNMLSLSIRGTRHIDLSPFCKICLKSAWCELLAYITWWSIQGKWSKCVVNGRLSHARGVGSHTLKSTFDAGFESRLLIPGRFPVRPPYMPSQAYTFLSVTHQHHNITICDSGRPHISYLPSAVFYRA